MPTSKFSIIKFSLFTIRRTSAVFVLIFSTNASCGPFITFSFIGLSIFRCLNPFTSILKATRKLSAQDNDMSVSNVAKVTELKVTDDPALIEKISSSQEYFSTPNPTEEAYATVTPPTGKDKLMNVIYGVTSAIALVLLSAGIIVIKRKVIDKK